MFESVTTIVTSLQGSNIAFEKLAGGVKLCSLCSCFVQNRPKPSDPNKGRELEYSHLFVDLYYAKDIMISTTKYLHYKHLYPVIRVYASIQPTFLQAVVSSSKCH